MGAEGAIGTRHSEVQHCQPAGRPSPLCMSGQPEGLRLSGATTLQNYAAPCAPPPTNSPSKPPAHFCPLSKSQVPFPGELHITSSRVCFVFEGGERETEPVKVDHKAVLRVTKEKAEGGECATAPAGWCCRLPRRRQRGVRGTLLRPFLLLVVIVLLPPLLLRLLAVVLVPLRRRRQQRLALEGVCLR